MKTKKFISLINDERKDRNVISQKGCNWINTDECSSVDAAHCSGVMCIDSCEYDYGKCSGLWTNDVCDSKDN